MQKAIVIIAAVWPAVSFILTVSALAGCNLLVAHEEEEDVTCRYKFTRTEKIKTCDTIPAHWELGP